GAMFGLTLSGLILFFFDWRFLFYINIPVGIFGTLWARRRLHEQSEPERRTPMDWPGFVTFTAFITSLLLALTFAAYGIGETLEVFGFAALSTVTFILFVRVERSHPHPLLDFRLLHIREFTGGVVTQLINAIAWGAFILLVSLYLQLVRGLSPLEAGIAILPFDVALLFVGPLSGRLSDKFGTRPFTTAGLAVVSLSLILFSTVSATTSYIVLVAYLSLGGAGMGLFVSPNMSSIMGSVPSHRRGVASALRATFFNVGFTLSFNVVILVLTFYLPYEFITQVISTTAGTVTLSDTARFTSALDDLYVILAVINSTAIIPSLLRGPRLSALPTDSDSNTGESSNRQLS
ncbi:MAG TPA: MFS transporter, partial [Nitrososphaerales archaeon]|nr:MFS transporter [Nitrososphaerales archaeon]